MKSLIRLKLGNYDRALELINEAIKINPQCARNYVQRARILIKLNKFDMAIKDCDESISINPDYGVAYKFRGRAKQLLGRLEEAYYDYGQSCNIDYNEEVDEWMKEIKDDVIKIQASHPHK
ncbi:hypothetical protein HZS_7047 [Henneguya salminicola]|uniref:Hsc70-interacting protein (Trinotate prediction) n=1 Tax=Henneguya salminicola TaxID=69463 RepID=A0A6G3MED3_HENSL|nr:hypothetical protein HZS_7047 [Henneguya salminicola]